MDDAVIPLPTPDMTPPTTKIYFRAFEFLRDFLFGMVSFDFTLLEYRVQKNAVVPVPREK